MAKRFNPAPGWPATPKGWVPPPGWQPDPLWPPAPPGWRLLVPGGPNPLTWSWVLLGASPAWLFVVFVVNSFVWSPVAPAVAVAPLVASAVFGLLGAWQRRWWALLATGVSLAGVCVVLLTGIFNPGGSASSTDPRVVSTIPVGEYPTGVVLDSETRTAYVANSGDNTVSVIDATLAVVAVIPVGAEPNGVAFDPARDEVWVANKGDATVSVIDTRTRQVVATVRVGDGPDSVATDPDQGRVVVSNFGSDTVSIIDAVRRTVVATIPVGGGPQGIAVDTSTHTVFVANEVAGTVASIDPTTGTVSTITVGEEPDGVAIDVVGHRLYVANRVSDTVSVIDTRTRQVTDTLPAHIPHGVAIDPGTHTVYVTRYLGHLSGSDVIEILDLKKITDVSVGNQARHLATDPVTHRTYVTNSGNDTVTVIQPTTPPASPSPPPEPATPSPSGSGPVSLISIQRDDRLEIEVGDCVTDDYRQVPCSVKHPYEIFAIARITNATLPSDADVNIAATKFCTISYRTYMDQPHATLPDEWEYMWPNQESWNDGDRSIVCDIHIDPPATGSIKDR